MPKGWDRVSLELNTRPVRVERDISREDLLVPQTGDRLRLIAACLACGLGIAFLFVSWPLMLVALLAVGVGTWILPLVFAAALVFATALYVWELRNRRNVAEELRG
jgi:Flp pilus assembly protein TadB